MSEINNEQELLQVTSGIKAGDSSGGVLSQIADPGEDAEITIGGQSMSDIRTP